MPADFSMPAEWEPHLRTWMCWPCRAEAWDGAAGLAAARRATADVARAIATFEPVTLAVRADDAQEAAKICRASGESLPITLWPVPLDDSWARDIGPTFVKRGADRLALQWRFNAWGGKYAPYDKDAAFAARVAGRAGVPVKPVPLICEGGAIHSDGQGTLLTTEQCLLNPNRNPGLDRDAVTQILCDATGAARLVWLGEGFSDTETDGHVDNIACFAAPGRVIVGVPESKEHPDSVAVAQAVTRLKEAGMEVIELVQPATPRRDRQGRPLQQSYVNFYLCNGGLVMPAFDDPNDEKARALLADCFPGRHIVAVPALDIVAGGGGIHCITQQEPA